MYFKNIVLPETSTIFRRSLIAFLGWLVAELGSRESGHKGYCIPFQVARFRTEDILMTRIVWREHATWDELVGVFRVGSCGVSRQPR